MLRNQLSFSKHSTLEEPTVNLTPLIDVVFVILIMFIVIAPLLELDRVELASGPSTAIASISSVQENSPITIHVGSDNTIRLNNELVTSGNLAIELKKAKAKYPRAHPQVFHDQKAYFGTYQMIKNAAEEAGFSTIDMILKPA